MAAMNSSVLACNYALSGTGSSELNAKMVSMPAVASPVVSGPKLPLIRAQQARADSKEMKASEGRRAALVYLAATLFTSAAAASSANAGVIEDYLEKSKANKELNDKKRLATSGANFARAYTVQFGTCKFPENFTGCQDLAKQKCHLSLMIWLWSVKERTNTSVVPMFFGNGEEGELSVNLRLPRCI
uniref:Photosystem I reaction center subunit N, chloroplastic n=1 Tax=Populus tomentosa TaxID=118781 RepID=A0A3Q9EEW5_POPTO|nr:photosynthetic electron transport in photosystem I [Populus tomentosa]